MSQEQQSNKASESKSSMVRANDNPAPYGVDLFLGPNQSTTNSIGIDFRAIFRYRWSMIFVFVGLAVSAVALVWTRVEPMYSSTAVIHVASYVPHVIYKTGDTGKMPLYGSYLNTQVSLIQSPDVLDKVVEREDIQQTQWFLGSSSAASGDLTASSERLGRQIVVRPRRGTELIDVVLETLDPRESQIIVNAVAEEYKKYWDRLQEESDLQRRTTLRRQRENLETEIGDLFTKRYTLTEELGSNVHEEVRAQKLARLNELRIKLQQMKSDKAVRDATLSNDEDESDLIAPSADTAPAVFRENEAWQTQFATYQDAKRRLMLAKQQYGTSHPTYLQIAADLENAERTLKLTEARLLPGGRKSNRSDAIEKMREDQVLAAVTDLQAEVTQTDRKVAELARTEERYKERKLVQKELDDRLHALEMERNAPERVTIQSTGQLHRKASTDRRTIYTACGIAAAFLAAFGLGLLRSRIDHKVHGYDDIRGDVPAGVPFLGQLPRARDALNASDETLIGRAIRENMRIVRTMLLRRLGGSGGSVVITSPEASSGKTTVSILLARSVAAMGKRVLLVDADFLHPSASRYFELTGQQGLKSVMSGEVADEAAIVPTDNEFLSILPAGERFGPIDRDVLANGAFSSALQRWRAMFDFVLIDSPPVLAMADARIAAGHADGVVMVMRSDGSRREDVVEAFAGLSASGARLLGTMLVGVPHGNAYYPYDYHRRHLETSELLA